MGQSETLGVVGESGSGRTTIGRAVLGLVSSSGGTVRFQGNDITRAGHAKRRVLARNIQAVFQDPHSSLNPALTIGDILGEPLIVQGNGTREARRRVAELFDQVVRLIVHDEPVYALHLTTQARVLDLLVDIQRRTGVPYLFISHRIG
ncbi:ATP-binding cassette domain-containing protein [Streptomyces sviceus]|uniref:ATP-binding cassette domain-containing protein n=1 Tax=Streptomyces sviceus TaxID=285530 RepID=UPI0036C9BD03